MADTVIELPTGYYRDNVLGLLQFVETRYSDLLTPTELAYARRFTGLSLAAQRLYVRLVLRKGPLFRRDKLHYEEIADLDGAMVELSDAGLLDQGEQASYAEHLQLLVKSELARLVPPSVAGKGLSRDDMLAYLLTHTQLADFHQTFSLTVLQPLGRDILRLYRLLFFGNLRQDFTDFVLSDLGIVSYESYEIDSETRLFRDRSVIDEAMALAQLRDLVHDLVPAAKATELLALAEQFPAAVAPGLAPRLDKLLNQLARQLERLDEPVAAAQLYARSNSGNARERRARLYAKADKRLVMDEARGIDQALSLCSDMITAPWSEAERVFAEGFRARLQRKLKGGHRLSTALSTAVAQSPTRTLVLPAVPDQRVEQVVVTYFNASGAEALHSENSLFTALFGLAFWDIIFAPGKGAFFNPFQLGPADLFTPEFQRRRAREISLRFNELTSIDALAVRTFTTLRDKYGRANPFVNWGTVSQALLERCFECIPLAHLRVIFERLLADPRANRSGFPDLIVFTPGGGYCLAEVKGPGDQLQANQRRWLACFAAHDIPHEVVRVKWAS